MQSGQRIDREMAAFVPDKYDSYGRGRGKQGKEKLSGGKALLWGIVLTLEIIILGAMFLHVDFSFCGPDCIDSCICGSIFWSCSGTDRQVGVCLCPDHLIRS